jgi:hypothetical protein
MDMQRVRGNSLPPPTIVVLEDIARRLDADYGDWRIELEFSDGAFQVGWRHQRVTKSKLLVFDVAAGAAKAPRAEVGRSNG